MRKFFLTVFAVFALFSAKAALAFCPVCIVAVGAGLGLSRWLGVDDTVSGLWIGGLVVGMIGWTIDWLKARQWNFKFYKIVTTLAYYLLVIVPLYFIKDIWHPFNSLWGLNKLGLGIVVGSLIFFSIGLWYNYLKRHHGGHAYFPYQKVVMPVVGLIVLSAVFYFITK